MPNQAMEETIAELVALAQRRGMHSFLASLEHDAARAQAAMAVAAGAMPRNGNGPPSEDPLPTAHAPGESLPAEQPREQKQKRRQADEQDRD